MNIREIVIPGEQLSEGKNAKAGFGTVKIGDKVVSTIYGLAEKGSDFAKVVPLKGTYVPRAGDQVIGIVDGVMGKGCFINLNSAYNGYLSYFRDKKYEVGDLLFMEVMYVNEIKKVDLDFAKPLYDGKLINVSPVKIPRIIGRKASMIDMLANETNCKIFVGRNGRIFIKGTDADVKLAENAIRLIEREAHTHGLTNKIKNFLESGKNGNEK